ncbi:unnamed protein product [Staurois parvus]|uniref:Secreted protein n=1 Tax=Staurois parvus TaxID=386267 RepID=A0ABN9GBY4_9NEOB|nr:unnamed protein product [Staurois parvus]
MYLLILLYHRGGQLWPSSCCRTTSPMRHCKTDSYKYDSQRQRHDRTCSSPTAGGPQLPTPVVEQQVP